MRILLSILASICFIGTIQGQDLSGNWKGYFVPNNETEGRVYNYELEIKENANHQLSVTTLTHFLKNYSAKATAAGIVIAAEITPEYGNIVRISHGSGLETRYAHASKLLVKEGDRIKKNQVIALVGNTGRSTGPHLHYEIRMNGESLDPRKYLQF